MKPNLGYIDINPPPHALLFLKKRLLGKPFLTYYGFGLDSNDSVGFLEKNMSFWIELAASTAFKTNHISITFFFK